MENKNEWIISSAKNTHTFSEVDRKFLPNVLSFMGFGLLLTGFLAYTFGTNPFFTQLLISAQGGYTIFGYLALFGPLIIGLTMSFAYEKMSTTALFLLFTLYAALVGSSFGVLFLVYDSMVIVKSLTATAITFGVMAVMGYTTNTDLTKMGSILNMMLIGILIASLVNFFTKSSGLDYIISIFGVIIFTGLTAYDMQQIKLIGQSSYADKSKVAIMGALKLYLDFINLFIFMLRIFGGRREN